MAKSTAAFDRKLLIPGLFWMAQLEVCAVASLWQQNGSVFVKRISLARDLQDFTNAASTYLAHGNPYADPRFVTPPFSLTVGWIALLAGTHAAAVMFSANILFLLLAVFLVCRRFGVSGSRYLFVTLAAFSFYPVFFLLERGNIDGILFLLFGVALATRNRWLQLAALSVGNNLKLYTLVPTVNLLWRGRFRYGLTFVACMLLISLPFLHLDAAFLHNLAARTQIATGTENLSPALIIGGLLKYRPVKVLYFLAWLGSLSCAIYRLRKVESAYASAWLVPWMVALPLQVYPYSGVLLLFVWIVWLSETTVAADRTKDWLVMAGLCLAGVQQQALTNAFGSIVHSHRFFPFLNALGVLLLMVAVLMKAKPGRVAQA